MVTDPTWISHSGAKIGIVNTATVATSETIFSTIGSLSQLGLTAGQYEIAVAHPGFSTFKENAISLESSAVYTVNAILKTRRRERRYYDIGERDRCPDPQLPISAAAFARSPAE